MADVTAVGSGGAGLGTPAARWALCAVWALGVTHGAIEGDFAQPDPRRLAAYAVALLGAVLLTTPGDRTLDRARALAVSGAALTTAGLVFASGAAVGRTWLVDFASYLVALLIARGNTAVGGAGAALVVGSGAVWAWQSGSTGAAELLAVPVMAVIVGVIWRSVLRHIVGRERLHRTDVARAALAAELAEQAAATDRRELAEIRDEAAPLLTRLARGQALDDRVHRELAVAEAAIRDRIRAPWAQHPTLVAAISGRRRSGVDVLLLGERPGHRETIGDGLAEAISGIIGAVEHGSITIRAVPPGRGPAVSVLLGHGPETGTVVRTQLAEDGSVLARSWEPGRRSPSGRGQARSSFHQSRIAQSGETGPWPAPRG